jgi:flavin-dependent dehydrogenase
MTAPDVIVVGAGPAGAAAALVLARAGVRVRMFDRERFPRPKLCGDTLNPGALATLDALGGDVAAGGRRRGRSLVDAVRARAIPLAGMIVTGPRGASVTADYPRGLRAASIERRVLDALLVEAATSAGAVLEEGVSVRAPLVDGDGTVTGVCARHGARESPCDARVVIVASGRGSRLAADLGLSAFARHPRRWAFGAYFDGVAGVHTHGEMHLGPDGYIGLAPLPCHLTNVCVVRAWSTGAPPLDHRRVIDDAIRRDPRLRERFTHARQATPVSVLGPLAVDNVRAGCAGALAAGDAAGFVDPMTGDGLRFALRGGMLAAEAALAELSTGRPAWMQLQAARARAFSGKWRFDRTMRAIAASPRAIGLMAAASRRWAQPVRLLVGVAGDVGLAEHAAWPASWLPQEAAGRALRHPSASVSSESQLS